MRPPETMLSGRQLLTLLGPKDNKMDNFNPGRRIWNPASPPEKSKELAGVAKAL